jgi:hypothetical protein
MRPRPQQHNPPPSRPRASVPVISGHVEKRESWTPGPPEPHVPAAYDDWDMRAWQALNRGEATPEQQRRCLEHLFFVCNPAGSLGYVPGDPYASAFENGKRRVGIEISNIISRRPSKDSDTEQGV